MLPLSSSCIMLYKIFVETRHAAGMSYWRLLQLLLPIQFLLLLVSVTCDALGVDKRTLSFAPLEATRNGVITKLNESRV